MVDIKGLSRDQLVRWFENDLGETELRARRVFQWLWQRGATTFDEMDGVPLKLRARLAGIAEIRTLDVEQRLESTDGTTKFLWKLHDGWAVESVLIPDGERLTLCMSSQVGCAMACTFCLTGDLGLKRNLTASEIAMQPLQVQASLPEGVRITNLVLMGMGEPLHNLKALVPALDICLDDFGMNYSHRRITVSTVGLVPKMAELANALPVNLAISINATTEEQRRAIMPITRKYSLADLIEGARAFPLPPNKRITFEYVMFDGFNDTLEDAARLYALLDGIRAKVNLIPYNENPHRDLKPPPPERVKQFQDYFVRRGMNCTVRTTRGLDISAACGQLGKTREQRPAIA